MIWNIVGMRYTLIMEWTLANIRNRVVAIAARSVRWLWVLWSVLLHVLYSFKLWGVSTLIFLRSQGFKLAWADISLGWLLQILIRFKWAFPRIILGHEVLLKNISIIWVFGKTNQMIKIGLECLLPLLLRNFLRINFLQLRESFYDERSVQLFLGTRVVGQPQHF